MNTPIWIGCSPQNYAPGRMGHKPEAIVIHLMAGTLVGTDAWFNTAPLARAAQLKLPAAEANSLASSAHYGIGHDGTLHQYVKEEDRSYHAGNIAEATWPSIATHAGINPNSWTIGIEHEGQLGDVWPEAMLQASAELIADICKRWQIPIDREHIVGHHEIYAPKPCPGPHCDLDALIAMAAAQATT